MKNKKIILKYVIYTLIFAAGIILGRVLFSNPDKNSKTLQSEASGENHIWTCSMHPQIRMNEPGRCPICGMNLISISRNVSDYDSSAVRFTRESVMLANITTSKVTRTKPVMEVRLYGKVQADERLVQSQTAHVPGRIENLLVSFTGESVTKGQALAILYSPELITAQQELLEATEFKASQPEIYEAAKEKLRHWKITEEQINSLEKSGEVEHEFEVLSNTNGIVIQKLVNDGDHVTEGTTLFELADLSELWILFDAYESDLMFLKVGDRVEFEVQALPGIRYTENIKFIDQVIDPVTRVAKVRIETLNTDGRLKPEMFVTGTVKTNLKNYANSLVVPKSAVMWTGKRSIVYVKLPDADEPVFKLREVELGPMLGNSYVVNKGLSEDDEIVTQGAFSVDAAAQLEGKPSMMNR